MTETESNNTLRDAAAQPESYESLRDGAGGDAGLAWQLADRGEARLSELYRELREDPRYTSDYKSERAWSTYEATREQIESNKVKARDLLTKQAVSAERSSIPTPDGESLSTTDPTKLLASQNEASRILRQIERIREQGSGPFKPDAGSVLREEYRRGMHLGGTEGGCICRGVLSAARELGISTDAVVNDFRKPRHHESLERAEHSQRLAGLISKAVPQPPFAKPGAVSRGSDSSTSPRRGVFQNPHGQQASTSYDSGPFGPRRKPSWK